MIKFDDYREKYSHIRMERQGGILQITFYARARHSKGVGRRASPSPVDSR